MIDKITRLCYIGEVSADKLFEKINRRERHKAEISALVSAHLEEFLKTKAGAEYSYQVTASHKQRNHHILNSEEHQIDARIIILPTGVCLVEQKVGDEEDFETDIVYFNPSDEADDVAAKTILAFVNLSDSALIADLYNHILHRCGDPPGSDLSESYYFPSNPK